MDNPSSPADASASAAAAAAAAAAAFEASAPPPAAPGISPSSIIDALHPAAVSLARGATRDDLRYVVLAPAPGANPLPVTAGFAATFEPRMTRFSGTTSTKNNNVNSVTSTVVGSEVVDVAASAARATRRPEFGESMKHIHTQLSAAAAAAPILNAEAGSNVVAATVCASELVDTQAAASETPVVVLVPTTWTRPALLSLGTVLFNTLQTPSAALIPSACAALLGASSNTGLSVHLGNLACEITPVVDMIPLRYAAVVIPVGFEAVRSTFFKIINEINSTIASRQKSTSSQNTPPPHSSLENEPTKLVNAQLAWTTLTDDGSQNVPQISSSSSTSSSSSSFSSLASSAAELLLGGVEPKPAFSSLAQSTSGNSKVDNIELCTDALAIALDELMYDCPGSEFQSIPTAVARVLRTLDAPLRPVMASCLVVSGIGARCCGLVARLTDELTKILVTVPAAPAPAQVPRRIPKILIEAAQKVFSQRPSADPSRWWWTEEGTKMAGMAYSTSMANVAAAGARSVLLQATLGDPEAGSNLAHAERFGYRPCTLRFRGPPGYLESYAQRGHMVDYFGASLVARIAFSDSKQHVTRAEYESEGFQAIRSKFLAA